MKKMLAGLMSLALPFSLATTTLAAPPPDGGHIDGRAGLGNDDRAHPLGEKQRAMRTQAQTMVLTGQAEGRGPNEVVRIANGQYVELARQGEDSIFTVLGEFGDEARGPHPAPGGSGSGHDSHGGMLGPQHNEIPEPDRTVDNTTIWAENFSPDYYMDLLFSEEPGAISMRNMYIEMSSGRYAVKGDVTDWAQVPYNSASYGSDYCGGIVCPDTWYFVDDSVDSWYQSQLAAGMTVDEIDAYLSQFDVWDRYDHNGNGNFDEPDGYIDHFQSVHAGVGQETGGGAYGSDAIWSHRWYVQLTGIGTGGPIVDGSVVPLGGTKIGESQYWIGDYTIEPENGGVGVFAHEFAHDLGLPDLYDTSGNTGGAENSTGFWTLMSSGSYGSSGMPEDGIGSKPIHMGNWEKFQLGWLNYEVASTGQSSNHRVGPAESNTKHAQGVFVVLPDREVPLDLGDPCDTCGAHYFYSGAGDNLDNTMTNMIDSVTAETSLTAKVRYDIETDWDYAYLEVSSDGGSTWTSIATNRSSTTNPNGQNQGFGITGSTGDQWVDLTASLPTGANAVRFRYITDGAVVEPGFQVDNIAVGGTLIGTAETEDEGWTFEGFRITTGSESQSFFNAYVLENRQYIGFDDSLRTGPYNFGFLNTMPNWVEHFSYQDGLLINYWNTQYTDNNVGDHPGEGLILPVDAHPQLHHWTDGTLMRPRILSLDSTFGREPVPALTLHNNGVPAQIPAKPAVSVFNDLNQYWSNCDQHACTGDHDGRYQPGWSGVDVPETGTTIEVQSISRTGFMQVHINK